MGFLDMSAAATRNCCIELKSLNANYRLSFPLMALPTHDRTACSSVCKHLLVTGFALHVKSLLQRDRILARGSGVAVRARLTFRTHIVSILVEVMMATQAFKNARMLLMGELH